MPFAVCYEDTQSITQPQPEQPARINRYADALQILRCSMPQNIIQGIAFLLEAFQHYPGIGFSPRRNMRLYRSQFEYGAVAAGHEYPVDPIPRQAADIQIRRQVRSQRNAGEDTPDRSIMTNIEMLEYFGDTPFTGAGPDMQLFVRETKKEMSAGFNQFGPVQ
jgi:hypothetical protein